MKNILSITGGVLKCIALFLFLLVAGSALAETPEAAPGTAPGTLPRATPVKMSAVGRWQTIDDKTGQPRAIVRIYETGGAYQGEIEKVFYAPGETKSGLCEKCPEPQRGKPVVGLTILWGLHTDKVGRGYLGGQILDPANATVYKCKLWLGDSGNTLDVRGYIGFTGVLGRTQRWQRLS
jgi:uncharacterized protein (DUF2147 family)